MKNYILILLAIALFNFNNAKSQSLTFSNEIQLASIQTYQYNSVELCRFTNNSSIIDFLATYRNKLVWYETDVNQNLTEHLIDEVTGGSYPYFIAAKPCQIINDYTNIHDDVVALYQDNTSSDIKLVYYTNDGNNNFSAANIISSNISSTTTLTITDVNNDLNADILVASDGNLLLFLNDGAGNFSNTVLTAGSIDYPPFIKAVDINDDNNIDIITNTNNDLQILLGDGTGSFGTAQTVGIGASSSIHNILVKDFDEDGDKDIVTQNSTNTTKLYKNDGAQNFTFDHEIFTESNTWTTSIAAGNYDGTWSSEYNDILTGVESINANRIKLLINDDSGNFIDTIQFTTSSDTVVNLFSIDFNSDTCMDVVAAVGGKIIWFKGTSCNTTNVSNLNKRKEISLYPNPAQTFVQIESYNIKQTNIQMFDISGKTINCKLKRNKKFITIDISNLQKGIYFIIINSQENTEIKKLIID